MIFATQKKKRGCPHEDLEPQRNTRLSGFVRRQNRQFKANWQQSTQDRNLQLGAPPQSIHHERLQWRRRVHIEFLQTFVSRLLQNIRRYKHQHHIRIFGTHSVLWLSVSILRMPISIHGNFKPSWLGYVLLNPPTPCPTNPPGGIGTSQWLQASVDWPTRIPLLLSFGRYATALCLGFLILARMHETRCDFMR